MVSSREYRRQGKRIIDGVYHALHATAGIKDVEKTVSPPCFIEGLQKLKALEQCVQHCHRFAAIPIVWAERVHPRIKSEGYDRLPKGSRNNERTITGHPQLRQWNPVLLSNNPFSINLPPPSIGIYDYCNELGGLPPDPPWSDPPTTVDCLD